MNKHDEISKYKLGDLVLVHGLLGLVVKKNDSILFSREEMWYLIDFFSKDEYEPRLVHENDVSCLTIK